MPKQMLRKNISYKEAECPCCKELPTPEFLDSMQTLRSTYGSVLNFTSMYRCPKYNRKIKGYQFSAHKVKIKNKAYGASDIKTARYNNRMRWNLIILALKHGFNNIEVANLHTHIARVPMDHSGYNKIIWGVSK